VPGPVACLTILEETIYPNLGGILRYRIPFLDQHRKIPSVAIELDQLIFRQLRPGDSGCYNLLPPFCFRLIHSRLQRLHQLGYAIVVAYR